jgi:hypothetical protein
VLGPVPERTNLKIEVGRQGDPALPEQSGLLDPREQGGELSRERRPFTDPFQPPPEVRT